MADANSESLARIERWKAEHPELAGGPPPPRPASPPPARRSRDQRPRLAPVPDPAPREARAEQRDMIERWRQEHPELTGLAAPRPAQQQAETQRLERERDRQALLTDRRIIAIDATPMSVLGAFIIGCILGGIAMTIITGIAFWGFSGG